MKNLIQVLSITLITILQNMRVPNLSVAKNDNRKNRSSGENLSEAALDLEKEKIKNVSNSENLSKALKDGRFDTLPENYHDRSSVLVEPT